MKITICGSIAFLDEMKKLSDELVKYDHEVCMPATDDIKDGNGKIVSKKDFYYIRKNPNRINEKWIHNCTERAIRTHFKKIDWADIVLITNYDKKDVKYVGANTLIEMGLAFYQKKPIFLLNPIPDIDCREEIYGMKPTVINGDLTLLS